MSSRKAAATSAAGGGAEKNTPSVRQPPPTKQNRWPKPASREGKRSVTVFLNEEAFDQLQRLSLDSKKPILALMREGVDALFETYNLPRKAVEE